MRSRAEGRAPDSRLNVWPVSPWPWIKRPKVRWREGEEGIALEITTCPCRPEENSKRIEIIKLGSGSSGDSGAGLARVPTAAPKLY